MLKTLQIPFWLYQRPWLKPPRQIPYTAKLLSGKTFAFFAVFQLITKVFASNHLLCTVHDGHGLMHHESFPVNSVFCAQPLKFSHSKVLPYTIAYFRRSSKSGFGSLSPATCHHLNCMTGVICWEASQQQLQQHPPSRRREQAVMIMCIAMYIAMHKVLLY